MPDLYLDVDVALAEVPVNILPLIDDTDFKSIEGAVAYNAAGMALRWHFVTPAGAYTVTSVTPTTGGDYDWTDQGDSGVYTIEIPASGGASINNDTEGFGWFTGVATGILPWRGPIIGFRRAALNDLLIEGGTASTNLEDFFDGTGYAGGTAKLTVDMTKILGTAVSTPATAGILDVNVKNIDNDAASASGTVTFPNATLASTANITAGTITTVTNLTNAATAGDFTATMKTSIGTAVAASAVASVTGNVGGNVTGSVGSVVGAVGSVTGNVGGNVTGSVGSVVGAVGSVTGAVGSVTGNVGGNVVGSVASVTGNVGGNVTVTTNNDKTGYALTAGERTSIADAHLDRADAIEVGLTPRQAHRLEAAAAAGKLSGAATSSVVIRNAVADSKDRISATVDADGNRSAVTTDVT